MYIRNVHERSAIIPFAETTRTVESVEQFVSLSVVSRQLQSNMSAAEQKQESEEGVSHFRRPQLDDDPAIFCIFMLTVCTMH